MSDDFMIRLERILEADTIDLRRLAEIGGGDPASFYVGTNLDGVDVRGQNLEGMKLSGLTPSRVRKDEDTQLPAPAPLEPAVEMIVLLTVEKSGPHFIPGQDPWVRFFAPHEEEAFFKAMEGFHGAVIIIAPRDQMTRAFSTGERLNLAGRESICLAADPLPVGGRNLVLAKEAGPFRHVIGVQSSIFNKGALGVDLRLLLKLLRRSRHWEAALHMAPDPVSYFARVTTRRSTKPLEAAAALFDRAAGMGLATRDCMLFAPVRAAWARDGNEWSRLIRPHAVSRGIDDRVLAALLPSPRTMDPREDYVADLAELLSSLGWPGIGSSHGEGRVELLLRMRSHEVRLPVINGTSLRESPRAPSPTARGQAHFGNVDRLVLSPDLSLRDVATGVAFRQVLALGASDLVRSSSPPSSIWSLIGNQLGRLQDEGNADALLSYLRLLLASAFDRGTVHHSDSDLLAKIVMGDSDAAHHNPRFLFYERSGDTSRALIAFLRFPRDRTPGPVLLLHLLIDDDGVAVSDEPLKRAETPETTRIDPPRQLL